MAKNPVGFEITNSTAGWNGADFDDVFIRKDCFLQGGLWAWGQAISGQLGDGIAVAATSSPVQTICGGVNWKNIDAEGSTSAAIKTDGTLWMWGQNQNGQLGQNISNVSLSVPTQTISPTNDWKTVSTGSTTAAIKTDGTLWVWGGNTHGALGNNTVIRASSPIQTISQGTNWKQVSTGVTTGYATSAIKTDGTLWVWGAGQSVTCGTMGDGFGISRSSPVQTISQGTNWKQVSVARGSVGAVKTDGTLWMWGSDVTSGQLGEEVKISRSSPVQTISGGTNWKQVSLTIIGTAAIKTDGTLWLWGTNTCGFLGSNQPTTVSVSSPIQTVSGGTNWRQVATGCLHAAAIKTDGSLWLWGNGTPLGNNSIALRSSPVQTISEGTDWKTVSGGTAFTMGIREDCW